MFQKTDVVKLCSTLQPLSSYVLFHPNASSPEVQRYLQFYGFDRLLERVPSRFLMGYFESGSRRLIGHVWYRGDSLGTVFVVHGLFDHVGLFLPLVESLLSAGFNVAAYDLPGHGLSEGSSASIGSFDEYGLSLIDFQSIVSQLPFAEKQRAKFIVGQSTGAATIMNALYNLGLDVNALVYFSPLVRPAHWPFIQLAYTFSAPFVQRLPRSFNLNSHNQDFMRFLEYEDVLQHRFVEVEWIKALRKWVATFSKVQECDRPLLVVQGTGDTTVDWRFNMKILKEKYSQIEIQYLEGARHHLVNEAESFRAEALNSCIQFLSFHAKNK